MPELPEVETVARGLAKYILGKTIDRVEVFRDRSVSYPDPDSFCQRLQGHVIKQVGRRGKYLVIQLDRKARLVIHLGMSGRVLLAKGKQPKLGHLRIHISLGDEQLLFDDPRVFGHMWYVSGKDKMEDIIPSLGKMGVEPADDLTGVYLQQSFRNRKQAIKAVLLDQAVIAGVGNIYADESLFEARINPLRSARELTLTELTRLAETVKIVLNRAIKAGGSTLRNYTDSEGVNGEYQDKAWVYGRKGKPCSICRTPIDRAVLAPVHTLLSQMPAKTPINTQEQVAELS